MHDVLLYVIQVALLSQRGRAMLQQRSLLLLLLRLQIYTAAYN